jgi:hypothetical protein
MLLDPPAVERLRQPVVLILLRAKCLCLSASRLQRQEDEDVVVLVSMRVHPAVSRPPTDGRHAPTAATSSLRCICRFGAQLGALLLPDWTRCFRLSASAMLGFALALGPRFVLGLTIALDLTVALGFGFAFGGGG